MNHTTRCFPRTLRDAFGLSPDDAVAMHYYKPPFYRRFFYALAKYGAAVFVLAMTAAVLNGCDDSASYAASQADLHDAIAAARQAYTVAGAK